MRPARILGFFFIFLLAIFIFKTPVFAQTQTQDLHSYTQNVMIEVTSSLTCLIAGVDPINPKNQCLGINSQTHKIGYVQSGGGAIGAMSGLIAMTFNIPIHTSDYVRYMAGNFGITKPSYAAGTEGGGGNQPAATTATPGGIGLSSLGPLTDMWVVFRNMVYLLFVLIFVVIGFAIMLRVHIDPRTVMTIENQIPKIIIALILVTFSFAIAGLLIDLMWIFVYLVIGVFSSIPGANIGSSFGNVQGLNALEVAGHLPGGIFGIITNSSAGVGGLITGLFDGGGGRIIAGLLMGLIGGSLALVPGLTIVGITTGLISSVTGLVFGSQILGFIGSAIAFIIIAVAILFALFRRWFQLIKAYVMILGVVVFSPFWILAGLLPGSRLSFSSLLRELGSNLITFPATIVMFLLGTTFINIFGQTPSSSVFVPPLIGSPATPNAIGAVIGLGIILLSSDVNKMMRKALQAPDFDFSAIAAAVGAGAGAPGRLVQGGLQVAFPAPYLDPKTGKMVDPRGALGTFARAFGFVH